MASILYFNGCQFDESVQFEEEYSSDLGCTDSNYVLIGCQDRLTPSQEDDLIATGAEVLHFSPPRTYVCRFQSASLDQIRSMPFVTTANAYPSGMVIHPDLKAHLKDFDRAQDVATTQDTRIPIFISLHPSKTRDRTDLRIELARILDVPTDQILQDGARHFRASIRPQDLKHLTVHDEVQSITAAPPPDFSNHIARADLHLTEQKSSAQNNFGWGIREATGVVVAITDSGLDNGTKDNLHPAISQGSIIELTSLPVGRTDINPDAADHRGHGTHCVGSIVGNGWSQEFGRIRGTAPGARLIVQSIGDEAVQDKVWQNVTIKDVLERPFLPTDDRPGAQIHSISFNKPWLQPSNRYGYNDFPETEITDEFVYTHREALIVHTAGNDGAMDAVQGESHYDATHDLDRPRPVSSDPKPIFKAQIGGRAIAKNILTIGATETSHLLEHNYDPYARVETLSQEEQTTAKTKKAPFSCEDDVTSDMVGNPSNVAYFSSRGPARAPGAGTPDEPWNRPGRWKPDLVAPGLSVYSPQSRVPNLSEFAAISTDYYGTAPTIDNKLFCFMSGTSHATSLAAGCAAIVLKSIKENRVELKPDSQQILPVPAAAIKAVLINSAEELPAENNTRGPLIEGSAPDGAQGHGLINVQAALRNVTDMENGGMIQHGPALDPSAPPDDFPNRIVYPITLQNKVDTTAPSGTFLPLNLSATVAWTDFPDENLAHELSLRVADAQGNYMYGNSREVHTAPYVAPENPGTPGPPYDNVNNVQKVVWNNISVPSSPGSSQIQIIVRNHRRLATLNSGQTQDFSLVWYVSYGPPRFPGNEKALNAWKMLVAAGEKPYPAIALALEYAKQP